MTGDTIIAIATAPGAAGVGIVRVSGPAAFDVVAPLFRAADGRPLTLQPARYLSFGRLVDVFGKLLDEVMVVRFAAPNSFTGEHVVEIQSHGGAFHLREVQAALLESSKNLLPAPRLARPGEFTQRAFLNGKIDLTRAEAVADLIHSGSSLARAAALRQLDGGLQKLIESLRAQTLGLLAECEAACDFPEEQDQLPDAAVFLERLVALVRALDSLLDGARTGRLVTQGVRVALAGAPNAGKSSLLNALSGVERAIVSDEPGTTRDWLEQGVVVQGLSVLLYDTAGLRESTNAVEFEGVRRARALARDADVLLLVLDRTEALADSQFEVLKNAGGDVVMVLNKSDLAPVWNAADLRTALKKQRWSWVEANVVEVSALKGTGLNALMERIVEVALRGRSTQLLEQVALTQLRHERAAIDARDFLGKVVESLTAHAGVELLALDLRAALDALGEIVGATPRSQVVEEIFRRFCIGK